MQVHPQGQGPFIKAKSWHAAVVRPPPPILANGRKECLGTELAPCPQMCKNYKKDRRVCGYTSSWRKMASRGIGNSLLPFMWLQLPGNTSTYLSFTWTESPYKLCNSYMPRLEMNDESNTHILSSSWEAVPLSHMPSCSQVITMLCVHYFPSFL